MSSLKYRKKKSGLFSKMKVIEGKIYNDDTGEISNFKGTPRDIFKILPKDDGVYGLILDKKDLIYFADKIETNYKPESLDIGFHYRKESYYLIVKSNTMITREQMDKTVENLKSGLSKVNEKEREKLKEIIIQAEINRDLLEYNTKIKLYN